MEVGIERGSEQAVWSPYMLTRKATELSEQDRSISEIDMAQKSEMSNLEIMIEMMLPMKQDDKIREERREKERKLEMERRD